MKACLVQKFFFYRNASTTRCKTPLIHFKQFMSVLSQKLQEASKLFQSHNFKKSLEAYQYCINFCHKTHQDQSILLNIMSTKATLQYVLGEYDQALTTLNSILSKDCCHFLALLRRSQVYKKKNKLKRALKDLEQVFVFCPDNLQISAFKVEIEHMLIKQGKVDELTSESEEQDQQEEENTLKFMNLKKIDRKSSDMSCPRQRKSRVTILGDHTFEYKNEETAQSSEKQEQSYKDKALRTYRQIESDNMLEEQGPVISIIAPKKAKKSILKNKGTSMFIQFQDIQQKKSKYLGRESKLLNLIKNIDGKVIPSAEHEHEHNANTNHKQVQFRKSVSQVPLELLLVPEQEDQVQKSSSKISNYSGVSNSSAKRKSCLKRPSFEVKESVRRRSKFEEMDQRKIDGKVLTNPKRKSIQQGEINLDKAEDSHSDNQGSQHNIFGSKGVVMTQDLKQKLGLLQPQNQPKQHKKQFKLKPKHSILKKNSVLHQRRPSLKQSQSQPPQQLNEVKSLRSKKSVMFNCTL